MAIERKFKGDLEATGTGYILWASTDVKSGVSVEIERVSGTLDGRIGTFLLQSSGHWTDGVIETGVNLVPNSGTEELIGIAGNILLKDTYGDQIYEFEYTLPSPNIGGE
jgi:hypothetical protein